MTKNPISYQVDSSSKYQDPVGDLDQLTTVAKGSLVEAINEVNAKGGSGGGGDYELPVATTETLGGVKAGTEEGSLQVDGGGEAMVIGFSEIKAKAESVGNLQDLDTIAKDTLVNSLNEISRNSAQYIKSSDDVTFSGHVTFNNAINVAEPTAETHAATKKYIDDKSLSFTSPLKQSKKRSLCLLAQI